MGLTSQLATTHNLSFEVFLLFSLITWVLETEDMSSSYRTSALCAEPFHWPDYSLVVYTIQVYPGTGHL